MYAFDGTGRFNALSWTNATIGGPETTVTYTRLPQSDLIQGWTTGAGGLTVGRSFEQNRNLITAVTNRWNASLVSSFTYTNDALGRRTQRLDTSLPSFPSVQTNMFSYNTRSELTGADMGTDNYTYVYDNIGNRITYTNNGAGIDYSANALNQYTQLVAGASQTNLLYDLDGNLTNDGVRVYSWNGENRLTGVEPLSPASGDKKVAVAYDYMGRRIEKVVSTYSAGWSVTQTNTYLYDGWNLVQETIRNPQSAITNHYTWGLDLSGTLQGAGGIGGLLAWTRSDDQKTFLYCFDANGNVTELLDADDGSLAAA